MPPNNTLRSQRIHIGIFGTRNAGKSSLINAITGQNTAIVSPQKGTTTDPVYKSMELIPVGPVVLIDTAGIDDDDPITGEQRIQKTKEILRKTDIAILVTAPESQGKLTPHDQALIALFEKQNIKHLVVNNTENPSGSGEVNAKTAQNIEAIKSAIIARVGTPEKAQPLIADKLSPGDMVVLVVSIDEAAPKGRLILPQQQTIRDILSVDAVPIIAQLSNLQQVITAIKPTLIITDSQIFKEVATIAPASIPLTSFSIIMARQKGFLAEAVQAASIIDSLQTGDKVLIAEGCTHHKQCDDIGTVKIPRMITAKTGHTPDYTFTSGGEFPEDVADFKLIIHCGSCMLNQKEVTSRKNIAIDANTPITNYGVAISHMQGILPRCINIFKENF